HFLQTVPDPLQRSARSVAERKIPNMLIEGAHTLHNEHLRRILNFFDVSLSIFEGAQILKSGHLHEDLRLSWQFLTSRQLPSPSLGNPGFGRSDFKRLFGTPRRGPT